LILVIRLTMDNDLADLNQHHSMFHIHTAFSGCNEPEF
jgi:hypothetical protein